MNDSPSRQPEPNGQPEGLSPEDPRLTAYAVGAMEAAEARAFEALLADDPAARAEVEALRALGDELARDLAAEGAAPEAESTPTGLDPARRAAVLAAAGAEARPEDASVPGRPRGTRLLFWSALATAAAVLVGVPLLLGPRGGGGAAAPDASGEVADSRALYAIDGETAAPEATAGDAWGEIFPAEPGDGALPASGPGSEAAPGLSVGPDSVVVGGEPGVTPVEPTSVPLPRELPGALNPSAGAYFNDGKDGDLRARTENAFRGLSSHGDIGGPAPGSIVRLDDVTNGLEDQASSGLTNGTFFYRGYARGGVWQGWSVQTHGEQYVHPGIDGFQRVTRQAGHTSTFSVDVDTASYANVRRLLTTGQRPHPAAVRIEEFVNYFDYGYAPPPADAKEPFAQHIQVATCPWNPKHRLARIALKGKVIERAERPASNLVFLVDVSGSMKSEDKLPLLQSALELLTENLDARDRISIVTYASSAHLALPGTVGSYKETILGNIRGLKAGGSTNGAGGIQLAYEQARKHFLEDGVNRVILCTDGDFNVGVSDGPGLTALVQQQAKSGVYLSVLGFGTGNLQDGKMEAYSNAGNGNYAYIDGLQEARKVLVEQMEGTLVTIAKDVKFQLWFNPATVHAWRLLGYENRRLAARDFNNDTKDAGDVGAGHEVTALYEIVPVGTPLENEVDPNPFVEEPARGAAKPAEGEQALRDPDAPAPREDALFVWRLRWKQPDGDTSALVERNVVDGGLGFEQADRDFQWAAGVTAFGMLLRHSPHRGQAGYALVEELLAGAKGEDPAGRRAELLELVAKAKALDRGGR